MSLEVILASGSESRRRLLTSAGVEAEAVRPNVDEDAMKAGLRAEGLPVRDQAMRLAELKAVKISQRQQGLVIGGDQMLALGDEAFDKPKDLDGARDHLRKLSGKAHTLETAIVVCENGQPVWRHLARPRLTMRPLSEDCVQFTRITRHGGHMWHVCDVKMSTHMQNLCYFVIKTFFCNLLNFVAKSVVS